MAATSSVVENLRREIEVLKSRIDELTRPDHGETHRAPHVPLWTLIRDYLRTEGGSSTPREIAEALVEAGHDLGKYPLRNVKITITRPSMREIFKLKKRKDGEETVTLVDAPIHFAVKKWEPKMPVRATRAR